MSATVSAAQPRARQLRAWAAALGRERLGLWLLLGAFAALGACYAVVTPLFEVSDELWHYPMVKTLADGNGLPVQDPANPGPWRQEGSQPPLYYGLMALVTAWIDTSDLDEVRWVNPHADNGVITPDRNNNIIIHTQREQWPWRGAVLAVRLIRLLSVGLGALTVYFTYRLGGEAAPDRPGLALAAAAFVAFTPMFVFVSASVNNDNLAITLSTAALWLMACWLRGPAPAGWRAQVVMGLLLAGAALSKSSALGLWPLAACALAFNLWRYGAGAPRRRAAWRALARPTLTGLALVFVPAVAASGWWFWRNFSLYGDWLGWSAFLATVGERPHPATLAQLWGERVGFVQAFWGLFGGVSIPMPGWTYPALNFGVLLAVVGLAWAGASTVRRGRLTLAGAAVWGLLLAWLVLIVVGLVRWTSLTWASQGRLIFPAIGALAVLVVAGLSAVWRYLPAVYTGFLAVLAALAPFTVIAPAYAPPPPLTAAEVAAIPGPLNDGAGVSFGGEMTLLGYALDTPAVQPGEAVRLTLYWRSDIRMDRNWSIFVHVVDEAGVIVAQRDRYPGQGTLATTLLEPGQTFADAYVIPIPEVAYAPAEARLDVGLYDLADGARARLPDGTDALTLAPVALDPLPAISAPGVGPVPNPFRQNFGNQIELVGYDMNPRVLRPGDTLRLTLYWRALAPVAVNYSVFAHVRGEGETLWAGQDAWPQQGAAPTSTWQPGAVIVDTYDLVLKPDTPPRLHDVEVGLYDADGVRLQAIADDGRPTDLDFVFLSKVRVVP